MTRDPACCGPDDCLTDAAKIMLTRDCGSVPVVNAGAKKVIGLVTDRDIAVRGVASGRDPGKLRVKDVMSHPVLTVGCESDLTECVKLMEANQVRRAPVVDNSGCLVGMVATADVARAATKSVAGELVKEISKGPEIGHT